MKVKGLFLNAQSTRSVPAGGLVFREGDEGSEMFGIVEGQIQLQTSDRVIATLGPDDVFGEMAIVDRVPADGDCGGDYRQRVGCDRPTSVSLLGSRDSDVCPVGDVGHGQSAPNRELSPRPQRP